MKLAIVATLAIALSWFGGCDPAPAFGNDWSDREIADAIWEAEGGYNTIYPYGIRSIDTGGDVVYARRICLNSIHNHRRRHAQHVCGLDFVECFGRRYCPPEDHRLNRNWLRLVKYFLVEEDSR